MDRRVKIGVVGVDSGQLVVCDPAYIRGYGNQRELNDYEALVHRVDEANPSEARVPRFAQLRYDMGHDGLGVVFDSGLGDGEYEVWATIGDLPDWGERIKKVEIVLVADE